MIDGLLDRELVSRVEDPTDRRAVVISLTSKGRTALGKKQREYAERRSRLVATPSIRTSRSSPPGCCAGSPR